MPDPWQFLQALGLAAGGGCLAAWGLGLTEAVLRRGRPGPPFIPTLVLGLGVGLCLGLGWLGVRWTGPPANGLNRLLWLVLPATLVLEALLVVSPTLARSTWWCRGVLVLLAPRVLLHGSVHLAPLAGASPAGHPGGWSPTWIGSTGSLTSLNWGTLGGWGAVGLGALWLGAWWLLERVARRTGGVAVPGVLSVSLLAAGVCIMLGGYLKGGAVAFPLAGVVAGLPLAASAWQRLFAERGPSRSHSSGGRGAGPAGLGGLAPVIAVGVVGLGGLLLVGSAFGRLLPLRAIALGCAPVLYALPLGTGTRSWRPGQVLALRLALVLSLLGWVVFVAKRDFDEKFRPLLGSTPSQQQLP